MAIVGPSVVTVQTDSLLAHRGPQARFELSGLLASSDPILCHGSFPVCLAAVRCALAGELVLSIWTVERHMSNINGKTGSGGRADATASAFTSGLMSTHIATK